MVFYARENLLGPSVYTEYVEETLAPLNKGGPLPENDLDVISFKNEQLNECLMKHFETDGEEIYHKSQFLIFIYAAEFMFESKQLFVKNPSSSIIDFC